MVKVGSGCQTHYIIEDYKCRKCSHVFPIPRKGSLRRKVNHIKNLWCPTCGKRTKHEMVTALDEFADELVPINQMNRYRR